MKNPEEFALLSFDLRFNAEGLVHSSAHYRVCNAVEENVVGFAERQGGGQPDLFYAPHAWKVYPNDIELLFSPATLPSYTQFYRALVDSSWVTAHPVDELVVAPSDNGRTVSVSHRGIELLSVPNCYGAQLADIARVKELPYVSA